MMKAMMRLHLLLLDVDDRHQVSKRVSAKTKGLRSLLRSRLRSRVLTVLKWMSWVTQFNPLPQEPITDFSWRNFFALINYLRIMQKICKNKAHRNLLLVQYKSSNIIRKSLKNPSKRAAPVYPETLQEPGPPTAAVSGGRATCASLPLSTYIVDRSYVMNGFAGSDVDAEVEEALPLEQALRSLTHWFKRP